jgi:hypothetical protein
MGGATMNAKRPFRFLTDTSEQLDGPALAVFARRAEHHAGRNRGEDRLGARGRGRAVRELELNTYPTGGPMVLTSNARAEAARRADQIRERTGVGLTVEEVLESPLTFIGSIKELTRKVLDLREHLGISSFLFDDMEAFAPVVEELAGR